MSDTRCSFDNIMYFINVILSTYFVIMNIQCNELDEEVIFPPDSIDQKLVTEKVEENVDIFRICEEGLGCIETDQTWYHKEFRPINLRPLGRNLIKTEFILIKPTEKHEQKLVYTTFLPKIDSIKKSKFNIESELMILIHDFTSNGYTGWIKHLSYKIFSKSMDYNLVSVDWQKGAEPPYDQAIANARFVALEITALIKELKEKLKYNLDDIHIVGHGVGAHIAGYVGMTYNKIKKITGLDPSGLRFQGMPFNVKLNPRCAKYVEVIHTDYFRSKLSFARSQGINETLGHSDFFVNGGKKQPGCTENKTAANILSIQKGNLRNKDILPGCSHKRAFKYFVESIGNKNCTFQGIRCGSLNDFENGQCTSCNLPNRDCRKFGLKTYLETSENNMFFLNTATKYPFCMLEYKVIIIIRDKEKYGYFDFIFVDENANIAEAYLSSENQYNYRVLTATTENGATGNNFVYFGNQPKLRNIQEIKARWNEERKIYCLFFCAQTITVDKIMISFLGTGEDDAGEEITFCPNDKFLKIDNGNYVTFKRCDKKSFSEIQVMNKTTSQLSTNKNRTAEIPSTRTVTETTLKATISKVTGSKIFSSGTDSQLTSVTETKQHLDTEKVNDEVKTQYKDVIITHIDTSSTAKSSKDNSQIATKASNNYVENAFRKTSILPENVDTFATYPTTSNIPSDIISESIFKPYLRREIYNFSEPFLNYK